MCSFCEIRNIVIECLSECVFIGSIFGILSIFVIENTSVSCDIYSVADHHSVFCALYIVIIWGRSNGKCFLISCG